nr:hypothetical protein [Tanacetum cinerariifolium]
MMVQAQEEVGEGSSNLTDLHHTPTIIQPSTSQPRKKQKYRKPRRNNTEVPQLSVPTSIANEAVNEEMYDSLERVATTTTSLDAEQDRGNIFKTQSKATPNEPGSHGTSSDGGPRVKKLEKKKRLRTHKLKILYKVGLSARVESSDDEGFGEKDASKQGKNADIDTSEDIYLVNVHNDEDMFGVNDLDGDEVIVESEDVAKPAKEVVDDITLAKALMEIKSTKPKADKVVIQEPEHGTTITTPTITTTVSSRPKAKGIVIHNQEQVPTPTVSLQQPSQVKDKGKAKMIKEPMKLKKKDQIQLDEEVALKLQEELQAKFKKEQILENYELAQRLQAEEQDELTDAKKAGTTTPKTLSSRDHHGCHYLHATATTAITIYTSPPPLLRLPLHHRHPMAATITTVTPTTPRTTTTATPPRVFTEGCVWLLRHRRIKVRWFWFNTTKGAAGLLINIVGVFVLEVNREEGAFG